MPNARLLKCVETSIGTLATWSYPLTTFCGWNSTWDKAKGRQRSNENVNRDAMASRCIEAYLEDSTGKGLFLAKFFS
jgi:hypothetical protein